jgi:hypothetical protein
MRETHGYVYLICDPSNTTFKIGVTRDLDSQRLQKLQTGNSTELFISSIYETDYPFRLETMLHNRFRHKKELNEWFNLDASDVGQFKNICKDVERTIQIMLDNPFFVKDIK